MNKYKVIISSRAYSNILECVSFVKKVSLEAAQKLYKEIITTINSLSDFPDRYPEINGFKLAGNPIRKLLLDDGRYAILYQVISKDVLIYDILDNRKDNKLLSHI